MENVTKEQLAEIFSNIHESNHIEGFSKFWHPYSASWFIGDSSYLCARSNILDTDDYITVVNKLSDTNTRLKSVTFDIKRVDDDTVRNEWRYAGRDDNQITDMATLLKSRWERLYPDAEEKDLQWYWNVVYGHMIPETAEGTYVENFIKVVLHKLGYKTDTFSGEDSIYLDHNCGVDVFGYKPDVNQGIMIQSKPVSFFRQTTKEDLIFDIGKCSPHNTKKGSYNSNLIKFRKKYPDINMGDEVYFFIYNHWREKDVWFTYYQDSPNNGRKYVWLYDEFFEEKEDGTWNGRDNMPKLAKDNHLTFNKLLYLLK